MNSISFESADDTFGDLPQSVRDGYTFSGWYYDAACSDGQKVDRDDPVVETNTNP